MLEKAWDLAPAEANTFLQTLKDLERNFSDRASDNIQSSAQNGHSSGSFFPGQNAPSDTEIARGWRTLIDKFRSSKQFLRDCAKYGKDAFYVAAQQSWGTLGNPLPENQRVIVDTYEKWADLCDRYEVTVESVVDQLVSDEAVYLWMMDNLVPVHELRSDYSGLIIGGGVA